MAQYQRMQLYLHIERVIILIDGNNLIRGAEHFRKGYRVDFAKLVHFLQGEHKLVRAYFFDCAPGKDSPDHSKKQEFFDMLRRKEISIVERPLRYHDDGKPFQKGVDVALATEMLALCMQNAYDTAIIVSGDSDYAHAVDRVKITGKNVHCASFRSCLSNDLRKAADRIICLDDFASNFEFNHESLQKA